MTTVVMQKPKIGWNSGICDCCQDMNSCCFGFWCLPCFMCTTTGDFGESFCLPLLDVFGLGVLAACGIPACVPPVSLGMRVAVRHKYDIGGSICEDIMMSCCCVWCSWCQMNREIKSRQRPVTVLTTHPIIQPIPLTTTTQVISTQQSVGVMNVPQVAFAPAVQMAPIQSVTTVVQ